MTGAPKTARDISQVIPSPQAESWARTSLWGGLLVSLIGFLGYYDASGFVTPPPILILTLQLITLGSSALILRARFLDNIGSVVPLALVAVWAGVTLLWAYDPAIGLRRWLLVFVPGLLLCALTARDPKPEKTFTWFLTLIVSISIASGAFTALILVFADPIVFNLKLEHVSIDVNGWMLGIAIRGRVIGHELYVPRFSGLTSNPNSMGLFAAIGLVGLCAIVKIRRNTTSISLILIAGIIVFMLTLSGSRAAFAMAGTGIFTVILLRMNRRRTVRAAMLVFCSLVPVLYLATWLTGTSDAGNSEVFELRERADVWRIAIWALGDVWQSGFGFGLIEEAVYSPLRLRTAAHSLTLTVLLETGAIGLVLVLVAWFSPVLRTTQSDRKVTATDIAIIALLMGLFVHQVFDLSIFRYHWAHFVFVYLLGASAANRRDCPL